MKAQSRCDITFRGILVSSKIVKKSRSVLQDGSSSLGLFRKGKTRIIAKFHGTDLAICSHS